MCEDFGSDFDSGLDVTDVSDTDIADTEIETISLDDDIADTEIETLSLDDEITDEEIEAFTLDDEITNEEIETLSLDDEITNEEIETLSPDDEITDEEIEAFTLDDEITNEEIETLSLDDEITNEEIETLSLDDEITNEEIETLSPDDEITDEEIEAFTLDNDVTDEGVEPVYVDADAVDEGVEPVYVDADAVDEGAAPIYFDADAETLDEAEVVSAFEDYGETAEVYDPDDGITDEEIDSFISSVDGDVTDISENPETYDIPETDDGFPTEEIASDISENPETYDSLDALEGGEEAFESAEIPGGLDTVYDEMNEGEIQEVERVYDDFEQQVVELNPEFYETGSFYEQGVNEFGYEGTCGPTSQANAVNEVLGINELTENKVLNIAVDNGLCEISDNPAESGGTTTEQFMELYDKVNESIGDKIQTELYDFDNALNVEEMADKIDEGSVLNVAVDSATLWGENDHIPGTLAEDVATDHWITVTGVERDAAGNPEGFHIIDSGGGESYVDAQTYERMCFGEMGREMLDPTCIVVSKKEN